MLTGYSSFAKSAIKEYDANNTKREKMVLRVKSQTLNADNRVYRFEQTGNFEKT